MLTEELTEFWKGQSFTHKISLFKLVNSFHIKIKLLVILYNSNRIILKYQKILEKNKNNQYDREDK